MSGGSQQISVALLLVGFIALGATPYFGSPWPGVALCGLSLVPWIAELVVMRDDEEVNSHSIKQLADQIHELRSMVHTVENSARTALDATGTTLREQQQQINSLRNAASLRGTLGG